MRLLLTGASSLTGHWFALALADAGHDVTAVFRRDADAYENPMRAERVRRAVARVRGVHGMAFGDDSFLELLRKGEFDALCHHAAEVTDYKSLDFDAQAALAKNTHRVGNVLDAMRDGGCRRLVCTGTVFEQDEGAGSTSRGAGGGLEAFSPYGLSKGLTWQVFRFEVVKRGLALGKFVISNPFGPYEEPRFTRYLVKTWADGGVPEVRTPEYVRDNIHATLLAKCYERFVATLPSTVGVYRTNPSGYVESQGAFAMRVASELGRRWGRECPVTLCEQTEFSEPRVRINLDTPDAAALGWSESDAWDGFAEFYERTVLKA